MKLCLFLTFWYFLGFLPRSKESSNQKEPSGTYQYLSSDSMLRITLLLNNDNSFFYHLENDLTEKSCSGTWIVFRDTLILKTYSQLRHFKIKVKEYVTPGKVVKLGDVITRKGVVIPTALIAINSDTSKFYDPFDPNYILRPGDIKTLNLYIGRAKSDPYSIKNPKANKIDITVDMDQSPIDYIFMENELFLMSGNKIYQTRDSRIDSLAINMNEKEPIALIKVK